MLVLVVLMVLLHIRMLTRPLMPVLRSPLFSLHIYGILAFLSVVVTYFGVNLLLGGVHAYN